LDVITEIDAPRPCCRTKMRRRGGKSAGGPTRAIANKKDPRLAPEAIHPFKRITLIERRQYIRGRRRD
jgi:hypothetical protein